MKVLTKSFEPRADQVESKYVIKNKEDKANVKGGRQCDRQWMDNGLS